MSLHRSRYRGLQMENDKAEREFGHMGVAYQSVVKGLKGRNRLRPRCGWEDNIKMQRNWGILVCAGSIQLSIISIDRIL